MADTKLTALTAATSVASSDLVYISQGGASKKANAGQIAGAYPTSSFASLPSASSAGAGAIYRVTDLGTGGALYISTGSIWKPLGGYAVIGFSLTPSSTITGTTAETTAATFTVPAGLMTATGGLVVESAWIFTGANGNRTTRTRFGGASGTVYGASVVGSNNLSTGERRVIQNVGAANSQKGMTGAASASGFSTASGSNVTSSIDTTAAVDLVLSCQLANGADTAVLDWWSVRHFVL